MNDTTLTVRDTSPIDKPGRRRPLPALICAALALSLAGAAQAADPVKKPDPLKGMTPVEASKGLALPESDSNDAQLMQGRYLVGLLGCASCHTDGALVGKPDPARTLAGSGIGIAYTNPMLNEFPGAVYPSNLTPDPETGLGNWSIGEIVKLLRSGTNRHGRQTMTIMPWTSYAQLSDDDATAIASYLKSLAPIRHAVPPQVQPGNPAHTPLVHVGLYRSGL
jgi:mono/diheme cytochrome c family protein